MTRSLHILILACTELEGPIGMHLNLFHFVSENELRGLEST
jgi:hypothetical protein